MGFLKMLTVTELVHESMLT